METYQHRKGWLSKSQIQLFLQCPFKWKCIYIDELPQVVSSQRERGVDIHKQIENFYKDSEVVTPEGKHPIIVAKKEKMLNSSFYNFEKERIKSCVDVNGKFDEKYFKPLHQELKINNEELRLRGIIDAIYINPKDDGIIIIDWKSGKYRKNEIDNHRFELALYKELYEREYKQKVSYWGIFWVDANKLFFEKVDQKYVDKMLVTVKDVREKIENLECNPKPNFYCQYCEFQDKCLTCNSQEKLVSLEK